MYVLKKKGVNKTNSKEFNKALELLEKKPYRQINITDVATAAGIHRHRHRDHHHRAHRGDHIADHLLFAAFDFLPASGHRNAGHPRRPLRILPGV